MSTKAIFSVGCDAASNEIDVKSATGRVLICLDAHPKINILDRHTREGCRACDARLGNPHCSDTIGDVKVGRGAGKQIRAASLSRSPVVNRVATEGVGRDNCRGGSPRQGKHKYYGKRCQTEK
jgi:hypothetical protein